MPIMQTVIQGGGGGQNPVITFPINDGVVSRPVTHPDFTGITEITGKYLFYYQYYKDTSISGVPDFSGITKFSGISCMENMYQGSTNVSGVVNMGDVIEIAGGNCCNGMFLSTNITGADLHSLVKVGDGDGSIGSMFAQCSYFTSININSLEEIDGASAANGFIRSTAVTNVYLPSLKNIKKGHGMGTFCRACSSLQTMWFYALNENSFGATTVFNNMVQDTTGVTIHFPKILDPQSGSTAISSLTTYPNFGGTNTVLLFDIVTSLVGADTNTYTRSEKNSTATATAWKYNDVLYYTSGVSNHTAGVNEPSVGDTIYSDATCTTAVTTISSIA